MADIPRRPFGNTGLEVSALGLGGGQLGNSALPEPAAERLLNQALDLGLNVDYSLSRSMQLFGGYRLTDFTGDAEDFYGSGTTNSANVGLRFRF